MADKIEISSDFAILDVKAGRGALRKHFDAPFPSHIPVVIHGSITNVWGNDDGVSREFTVHVESVEVQS